MRKILLLLVVTPIYLISLLPIGVHYFFSGGFIFFICRVVGYRRATVLINISRSFPSFKYAKVEETMKKFYKNFSQIIAENIKLISASRSGISAMATIENPHLLMEHFNNNRSLIIAGGHIGNWELLARMELFKNAEKLGYLGCDFKFVYKRQSSVLSDMIIKWTRSRKTTIELIESKSAARAILKSKERAACFFLFADQAPLPGSKFVVNFMNQKTSMINGPEVLAKSSGCPVIFVEMNRVKRGEYSVSFHEITQDPVNCEPGYITEKYSLLLQQSIEKNPDNWLWTHKRWKRE